MKLGRNAKAVEEVLEFAATMNEYPIGEAIETITIIHCMDEAKRVSRFEVFGENEYTWSDIRQLEMAKVKGKIYQLEQSQRPVGFEDLTERITSALRKYIPDGLSDFFETMVVDLRNCAINRAINGMEDNFYNNLFKIYQSGGVPCGWKGNYPEGQMIAYYDTNRETVRRQNE